MPYQPNPFVNANQRGVELPPGCKDLMDVLRKDAAGTWKWRDEVGGLCDIKSQARRFVCVGGSPKFLALIGPELHLGLIISEMEGKLSLELRVYKDEIAVRRTLRRVFRRPNLCQNIGELAFLAVPVSGGGTRIASILTELLVEGYAVTEQDKFRFHVGWAGE